MDSQNFFGGMMTSSECWMRLRAAVAWRNLGPYILAWLFAVLLLPGKLFAGQNLPAAAPTGNSAPIVFAAASMQTALDAIAATWKAETSKTVKISYASSATLAKQIKQGAPADIFISADLKWMDYLERISSYVPKHAIIFLVTNLSLSNLETVISRSKLRKALILRAPQETAKLRFAQLIHVQREFTPNTH